MAAKRELTPDDVRIYMRDILPRNDLLERKEFTEPEVQAAMDITADKFNLMTPLLSAVTAESFPNKYLLLKGTVAHLLKGEAMAQVRNQLTYNDGGIHVGVDDKYSQYMQLAQSEMQEFETLAQHLKLSLNAEAAFGGQTSGYFGLPIF